MPQLLSLARPAARIGCASPVASVCRPVTARRRNAHSGRLAGAAALEWAGRTQARLRYSLVLV